MVTVDTASGGQAMTGPGALGPNAALNVSPFHRLARVHAGSTAGDAMVAASLAGTIFFAAATADARGRTFFYLVLTMAPFAVVAPLIGPALDRARSGRRWIVIGSAALRAVLCFLLVGRADTWLLYPAAFGLLVLQKSYGVARSSLVPAVVKDDEELVEANSKLQLLSGLMGFVGAVPAGLLYRIFDSPGPALGLAVCTFAATAGMALRLPKVAIALEAPTEIEKAEMRSVGVLLAAGATGLMRGIVGFLTLYFAFYFREQDELAQFGVVAAVSVLGSLLGAVVAPRLRTVWPEERLLISTLVLTVAAGVLALAMGGWMAAAVLGGVVGVASTAGKLAFDSIVQRDAPDANRGRLFARFETRFQLFWVFGALLGLLPVEQLRLSYFVAACVAGFAATSYVIGLAAWRHRTGATTSSFGRQAVLIDQAVADGKVEAKRRLHTSARGLLQRVRGKGEPGPPPPPPGPVDPSPAAGTPEGATDPTLIGPAPGSAPEAAAASDETARWSAPEELTQQLHR